MGIIVGETRRPPHPKSKLAQAVKKVSAEVFRPASKNEEIIIKTDTPVKVALQYDTDTKQAWLLIQVKSLLKPGLWGSLKVNADQDHAKIQRDIAMSAEAIALFQCAHYNDRHNPPAVAKAALEAYAEVRATAEKARQNRGSGK